MGDVISDGPPIVVIENPKRPKYCSYCGKGDIEASFDSSKSSFGRRESSTYRVRCLSEGCLKDYKVEII